ncbi:MAG: hypothetical protein ACLU93_03875 [Streptococcus sp.]
MCCDFRAWFSETVSDEATSEAATGASDTVAVSLERRRCVFYWFGCGFISRWRLNVNSASLMMASTVASLTGYGVLQLKHS